MPTDATTTDIPNSTPTDATATPDATATTSPQDKSSTTAAPSEATDDAPKGDTLLTGGVEEDEADTTGDAGVDKSDTTDADKDQEDPRAAFYGAPEGDYELTLPEGVTVDKEALAAFTPIAKELNLSSEGASKVASVYAEQVLPAVAKQIVSQIESDHAEMRREWHGQVMTAIKGGEGGEPDPAYAGMSLDDVTRTAAKAIDRFGGNEFRQYLEQTGLGNHPAMVKFATLAGKAISEDTTFDRGGGSGGKRSDADVFYGSKG